MSTHKSRETLSWFKKKKVRLLDWSPNSCDLNPIEHLWSQVKRRTYVRGPHETVDKLWDMFWDEWYKTEPSMCLKLIESMSERLKSIIRSKGGPTHW